MFLSVNWYDWITPTNPIAAIVIGLFFSFLIAFMVWYETREWKVFLMFFSIGAAATLVVTGLLELMGMW